MSDSHIPLESNEDQPEDFKSKMKKRIAGRNWTYPLLIGSFLSGAGLVTSGVLGFMQALGASSLNFLEYVVCIYLIALGLLVIAALLPFPASWRKLNLKWVPFLHTFRGRGFFLIFLGSLATGTNMWVTIIIGIVVIVIGLAHVLLACFFRNTLAASTDFDNRGDVNNVSGEDVKRDLQSAAVTAAWNNRESLSKV